MKLYLVLKKATVTSLLRVLAYEINTVDLTYCNYLFRK